MTLIKFIKEEKKIFRVFLAVIIVVILFITVFVLYDEHWQYYKLSDFNGKNPVSYDCKIGFFGNYYQVLYFEKGCKKPVRVSESEFDLYQDYLDK